MKTYQELYTRMNLMYPTLTSEQQIAQACLDGWISFEIALDLMGLATGD